MGRFGGPSFGTPKPSRTSRAHESSIEDAPPTESIYDYNGGSSFSPSQSTAQEEPGMDPSPRKPAPTLTSLPCAVIIFGFPSQLTSKVLDHFSKFGNIEEHSSSAAQNLSMGNNWMKITYRDSAAAQQAVGANGSFVAGQYMVGCVFAPDDPLTSIETSQDDAMDIDPKTPPRPQATNQFHTKTFNSSIQTPLKQQQIRKAVPASTPGGKRIEILNNEAIYKSTSPLSDRVAAWMPSWLSTAEEGKMSDASSMAQDSGAQQQSQQQQQQQKQTPGWTSRLLRGLADTIFGF